MNQQVKDLIQKLGEAIHESVSESDQISGVVREIREQGFDVLLMLEATIGFNKREDAEEGEEGETIELATPPESGRRKVGKIKLTSQDQKFLRALKIAIDDEGR